MAKNHSRIQVVAGILLHRAAQSKPVHSPTYRLCLARRSGHRPHAGYWELPGGKLESGESPEDALIREIREELGIAIQPLSEQESIRIGATPIRSINLDQEAHQEIQLLFLYALAAYTTKVSTVHDSVLWMTGGELERAMLPGSGYKILPSNQPALGSVLQMGLLQV